MTLNSCLKEKEGISQHLIRLEDIILGYLEEDGGEEVEEGKEG